MLTKNETGVITYLIHYFNNTLLSKSFANQGFTPENICDFLTRSVSKIKFHRLSSMTEFNYFFKKLNTVELVYFQLWFNEREKKWIGWDNIEFHCRKMGYNRYKFCPHAHTMVFFSYFSYSKRVNFVI